MVLQLEQVDEPRAQGGRAALEKAGDALETVAADESDPPGHRQQGRRAAEHRQEQAQPPAGAQVQRHVRHEGGQHHHARVAHAPKQQPPADLFLMPAIRRRKARKDALLLIQHSPHLRRKNQSIPDNTPGG